MPAIPRPIPRPAPASSLDCLLGTNICDRNPYRNQMQLEENWEVEIEEDSYQVGYWKFKDRSLRVRKAIRIPYTYTDADGNRIKEYLLIGYEGASGE